MLSKAIKADNQADLRLRALQRLTGKNASHDVRLNASAAFEVLYNLASSPSTGAAALALLHELQVYQVELDVQDEELRRSRAELEATLKRQVQLYDFAPVGNFTVDRVSVMQELNLAAASMLGSERDQLLGRPLDSFLAPQSARALHAMLTGVGNGTPTQVDSLRLSTRNGSAHHVHASVNRDPEGEHFLVAFVFVAEDGEAPRETRG